MPRLAADRKLGVVVFLIFFVIIVVVVRIVDFFSAFTFFVVIVIIIVVEIFGDDIQVDGMRLRHFQLGLTLGAAEDLALFHFVFVDVDFSGTLGAADHVVHPP